MISNPGQAKKVATGNYTGNGNAARQISTGFKCGMAVIIKRVEAATTVTQTVLIAGIAMLHFKQTSGASYHTATASYDSLHATDGFVVENDVNVSANINTKVYDYWAIEA